MDYKFDAPPLKHAVLVPDVTYVYCQRQGSIMSGTKFVERIQHFGYTFREIAEQIVLGERIEETEWVSHCFCNCYIDTFRDHDYQYAYKIFTANWLESVIIYQFFVLH